jgi:hypothetical protein
MENKNLKKYVGLIMEVNLLKNMERYIINFIRKV